MTRVLLIDDERVILFAMRKYFEYAGYEVDCATEREEAEALLANVSYDVVLADLRLTGIHGSDGLEILSFARERCLTARVMILTAHGSAEAEERARALGVAAFLHKPQPLEELERVVTRVVGGPSATMLQAVAP